MMMNSHNNHMDCDLLVIGSGFAGMAAAARASGLGLKTVQTGSSSGFYLASGLLDFLGVYPVDPVTRLKNPEDGMALLKKEITNHPYAKVSENKIVEAFHFVYQFLYDGGLDYAFKLNQNFQVLTAAGTFKPSFLVPRSMAKSNELFTDQKQVLLVDFEGLKGYSALQIAGNLKKMGHQVDTVTIKVPELTGDFNVTRLAAKFEDPSFLDYVAEQVQMFAPTKTMMGLPAVCGIHNTSSILKQLESITGMDCFEIPGLPPSIPGLRLKNTFEKQLSKRNITVLNNATVKHNTIQKNRLILDAVCQNFKIRVKARGVILATGRFPGGGLRAERGLIQETVFNIPVDQPDKRNLWYDANLFQAKGHGINQAGILTDNIFRPLNRNNIPLFENLYAAGSILSHNDWARLKSGAGVSIVSALTAVDHFNSGSGGDDV